MASKLCLIIGLMLSVVGTYFVGWLSSSGIPKKGEVIKAPKYKTAKQGWIMILIGFLLQLLGTILS